MRAKLSAMILILGVSVHNVGLAEAAPYERVVDPTSAAVPHAASENAFAAADGGAVAIAMASAAAAAQAIATGGGTGTGRGERVQAGPRTGGRAPDSLRRVRDFAGARHRIPRRRCARGVLCDLQGQLLMRCRP